MFIIATWSHLLVSNDEQLDFGLLLFFADRQLRERLGDRKRFGCRLHPDKPWYELKLFRLHCLATCVSMFSIRTPDHIWPYNKS